jgi:hypothetical protein
MQHSLLIVSRGVLSVLRMVLSASILFGALRQPALAQQSTPQ